MPPALPAFDVAAETARNNPQDHFAKRSELIASTIAGSAYQAGLCHLQAHIDVQRAMAVNPLHGAAAIMDTLNGKLSALSDQLAHWQAQLDRQLPLGFAGAQKPHDNIDALLDAIAALRERVCQAGGR